MSTTAEGQGALAAPPPQLHGGGRYWCSRVPPCGASSCSRSALSTGLRLRRSVRSGWMMVSPGSSLGAQRFLSLPRPSCLQGAGGGGAEATSAAGRQSTHLLSMQMQACM